MQDSTADSALSMRIAHELPYLRRYARALTGTQRTGDAYAAATLEAIVEDRSFLERSLDLRVALFRAFHLIWNSAGAPIETPERTLERAAHVHLGDLTPNTREALLLNTVEEFDVGEIAQIMQIPAPEVQQLLDIARQEMERSVAGKVLVIEDEAIIARYGRKLVTPAQAAT